MSLWWCLIYPWWFCNLQWLRPAGLYERCKLALELKRLKTPVLAETYYIMVQYAKTSNQYKVQIRNVHARRPVLKSTTKKSKLETFIYLTSVFLLHCSFFSPHNFNIVLYFLCFKRSGGDNNYCIVQLWRAKVGWDFRISDLVKKTLTELMFNLCGEFRWSPEGPVSQIHSPHLLVGAPGIFSDLLRSAQMLKREWGAESNGKQPHLLNP